MTGYVQAFFEMLIIFAVVPVSAPLKAMCCKELVTQVIFIYFKGKRLTAVGIAFCTGEIRAVDAVL